MRSASCALLLGLLVVTALPALARPLQSQHGWLQSVYFAADAGAAARQAAGMTGGKVLDVQTRINGGRAVYLVKILLNDGRVKVIQIDGAPAAGQGFYGQ